MKKTISVRNIAVPITTIVVVCFLGIAFALSASAADDWKATFDEICGKVQGADSLSNQELATLIEKADKLAPEIEKSDNPAKKVYLQRLKKSRNMYEFMLETRKGGEK